MCGGIDGELLGVRWVRASMYHAEVIVDLSGNFCGRMLMPV